MTSGFPTDEPDLTIRPRREGGAAVVALEGEVTVFTSPALRERLRSVLEDGPRRIVMDLSGVGYVDSSGVATLVEALREIRGLGGEMVLAGVAERVRGVLEIARLDTVFPTAETVEEALES